MESSVGSISFGLALSGGAARGAAHIGVLEVLESAGLRPAMISGTSVGALVGGLYAFGKTPAQILALAHKLSWSKISSFSPSRLGLLSNEEIASLVEDQVGKVRIEDAPIPLAIVATDIRSGEKVVFREGNLAEAVMASSCLPGIYRPVNINGRLLVDGFLVENVPLSPLVEAGLAVRVAVNLGAEREYRELEDLFDVILNAMEIAIDANTMNALRQAQVIIGPRLARFSRRDPAHVPDMYEEGRRAARDMLPQLQALVQPPPPPGFWKRLWRSLKG
ncbi:MAG: patatin [Calditrichaeota bacterium]|nr:MAG: patatin [Calditrichota bacterium]